MFSVFLGSPFLGPFVRESGLLLEILFSPAPCLGHLRQTKIQGTHYIADRYQDTSLVCHLSKFTLILHMMSSVFSRTL